MKGGFNLEDSKIIELYFSRNENAVTATKEKYSPYCSVIAKNILQSYEDTEEALSSTWLCAWNSIPPAIPRSLKTFLGRITRNISVDMLRKNKAQKRNAVFEPIEELSECLPSAENLESTIDAKLLSEKLNNFIAELPKLERFVLLQRYWYGSSLEDISDKAGINRTKVKNILAKLRKKLKIALEKEGFFV